MDVRKVDVGDIEASASGHTRWRLLDMKTAMSMMSRSRKDKTKIKYTDLWKPGVIKDNKIHRAPQRIWKTSQVHAQEQSSFVKRLPAEIRNLIYEFLWDDSGTITEHDAIVDAEISNGNQNKSRYSSMLKTTRAPDRQHPLSLLQTCRKIHLEATLLAFSKHIFTISDPRIVSSYIAFARLTSPLSPPSLTSISRLAYNTSPTPAISTACFAKFTAHALLLFPSLTHLELRIDENTYICPNGDAVFHDPSLPPDEKPPCVPRWLFDTVSDTTSRRVYAWQTGEKWRVEWPQQCDPEAERILQWQTDLPVKEKQQYSYPGVSRAFMKPCVCGCGMPSWLTARLVQETGRRPVELAVLYYGG